MVLDRARIQASTRISRLTWRLLRLIGIHERRARDVTLVGLDIVGFGRRSNKEQERLRRRLFEAVRLIRQIGGLTPHDVLERGDGVLLLLPGRADTHRVLLEVMPALAWTVRDGNRQDGAVKMTLRCALHKGRARRDRWGWVGEDVNLVFRLLDSRTLKRKLGPNPAGVTVGLSERFYRHACSDAEDEQDLHNRIKAAWDEEPVPHAFRTKEVEQTAWVASVRI